MSSYVALASIPRRVVAYVIDVFLAFAGVVALQAVLLPINPLLGGVASPGGVLLHAWVTVTVTLPIVLFFGWRWSTPSGATPGMRLLRLRVRSASGGRVPVPRALLRALVLLVPFELNHAVLFHPQPIWDAPSPGFRLGFVVVYALLFLYLAVTLRTPQRQGPHDLAAGTIVCGME